MPGAQVRSGRSDGDAGAAPLSPQRKWRAITLATLMLVPAYWAMIAGVVTLVAEDETGGVPNPEAAIAFGISLIPFVFIVLAFLSEHPRAPGAVLKAMGVSLVVGIIASALAADAVTGIVAGVGAGGAFALRPVPGHTWRPRALAVFVAAAYAFALVRTLGPVALLPAPIFPLTALGVADHLAERRADPGG